MIIFTTVWVDFTKLLSTITHHFGDDTNVLYSNMMSLKKIQLSYKLWLFFNCLMTPSQKNITESNQYINYHLSTKRKFFTKNLDFRMSGQKINLTKQTKYLAINLDEHFSWNYYLNQSKNKVKLWPPIKVTLLDEYYHALISLFCHVWWTPQAGITNLG